MYWKSIAEEVLFRENKHIIKISSFVQACILEDHNQFCNAPKNGYNLFLGWTPEFIVDSMLQDPHDNADNKEKRPSHNPHTICKWPQKSPSSGIQLFKWRNNNQPRCSIWLCKINNLCSICNNSNIANSSIKDLKKKP